MRPLSTIDPSMRTQAQIKCTGGRKQLRRQLPAPRAEPLAMGDVAVAETRGVIEGPWC